MAIRKMSLKSNVSGRYFVDNQCLGCSGCVVRAPEHFGINKEGAYIKKQPVTVEEEKSCLIALAGCPAKAIGQDQI